MQLAAVIAATLAAALPSSGCLAVRAPLAAGTIADTKDFDRSDCLPGKLAGAFVYDRVALATRISRNLSAGEIVPSFPEFGENVVLPGQKLKLISAFGAVRIEREVEAVQEARPGQRLFVRSADGQVVSARYEDAP